MKTSTRDIWTNVIIIFAILATFVALGLVVYEMEQRPKPACLKEIVVERLGPRGRLMKAYECIEYGTVPSSK